MVMRRLTRAFANWMSSPTAWAEARYQRRTLKRSGRWIGTVLLGVLVGAIFLTFSRPVIAANPTWFTLPIPDVLSIWDAVTSMSNTLLIFLVAAHYFLALSQSIQGGTLAIVREKQGNTWDTLRLTGIDARKLIVGKWAATVQSVWHVHRRMVLPRALTLGWLVVVSAFSDDISDHLLTLGFSTVILAVLGAVILPGVNIGLGSAIGMIGSLLGNTESSSRTVTIFIQVSLIAVVAAVAFVFLPLGGSTSWVLILLPVLFSSFDGGIMMVLTLPNSITFGEQVLIYLLAILIQIAAICFLTYISLLIARRLAVWQQVSQNGRP